MNEIWKSVVGYEGDYEVSSHGRVRSHRLNYRPDFIMTPIVDGQGRLRVDLRRSGRKPKSNSRQIHQLVLEAFTGPCPAGMEGAHNDGNHRNNRADNLRWDTHWNNMQDKREHGTNYQPKGELHHMHKLTDEEVLAIFNMPGTRTEIARVFNVHYTTVCDVKLGRCWSHVTGKIYRKARVTLLDVFRVTRRHR